MRYERPLTTIDLTLDAPTGMVGALGVRLVRVVADGPDVTVIPRTIVGVSEEPAGSGLYAVALELPADQGTYAAIWDNGVVFTRDDDLIRVSFDAPNPPSFGTYPTSAELVAESSVADLTALTPEQQDGLRASSIAAIEDYCRQSFGGLVTETKRVSATGGRVLYLPARLDTVTAVALKGASLTLSDVVLAEERDRIELPVAGAGNYYEQALRDLAAEPSLRSWSGMVNVTGDWGWPDCPAAVATAIRLDMEEQAVTDNAGLSPTIMAYRKLGVRDISQGNLRMTLGDEVILSGRVIKLLNAPGLLWQGIPGAVV